MKANRADPTALTHEQRTSRTLYSTYSRAKNTTKDSLHHLLTGKEHHQGLQQQQTGDCSIKHHWQRRLTNHCKERLPSITLSPLPLVPALFVCSLAIIWHLHKLYILSPWSHHYIMGILSILSLYYRLQWDAQYDTLQAKNPFFSLLLCIIITRCK